MQTHLVWFAVIVVGALAVMGAVWVAQAATPGGTKPTTVRFSLTVAVGCTVALLALGGLWRIHAVAHADGDVVLHLINDRGTSLTSIFSIVTTMGDLIPSFTIATVLAILLFRRSQSLTAWLLPVVVLAEVTIQSAWLDTFHDFTIAQVFPFITIGGTDGIPSGSMARLLSVFVLAAVLWGPHDARAARRIIDIGAVVIFVELVSRLYLARHLLADIVGGLLLGIVLSIVFGWIAHVVPGRSPNRSPSPAVSAGN